MAADFHPRRLTGNKIQNRNQLVMRFNNESELSSAAHLLFGATVPPWRNQLQKEKHELVLSKLLQSKTIMRAGMYVR